MADIGKAPEGFPRRMQAARALAGLTIEQLAEKLADEPGLGERSLRSIENGSAEVQRSRQNAIMEACGLPPEFASANFWLLEPLRQGLESMDRDLRQQLGFEGAILRAFRSLAEQETEDLFRRVTNLERHIRRLEDKATDDPDGDIDRAVRAVADEGTKRQSTSSATGRASSARNR